MVGDPDRCFLVVYYYRALPVLVSLPYRSPRCYRAYQLGSPVCYYGLVGSGGPSLSHRPGLPGPLLLSPRCIPLYTACRYVAHLPALYCF